MKRILVRDQWSHMLRIMLRIRERMVDYEWAKAQFPDVDYDQVELSIKWLKYKIDGEGYVASKRPKKKKKRKHTKS